MQYHIRLLSLAFLISAMGGCKKDPAVQQPPAEPLDVRVAGYIYSDNNWNSDLKTDRSLVTDLNLAFINPDTAGNFSLNDNVQDLIARAHAKNVRVYASF